MNALTNKGKTPRRRDATHHRGSVSPWAAREFRLHPLSLFLLVFGMGSGPVWARDYFDPAFLGGANVDLSAYETAGSTPEGTYLVDIYMNQQMNSTRQIRFAKDGKGEVVPELTPAMLREMGVAIDRLPALKGLPADKPVGDLKALLPASTVTFNVSRLRLDITVPQVDMDAAIAGAVDPKLWDEGVPAMMFSYNLNGSKTWSDGYSDGPKSTTQNLFSSVNGGANLGAWRLRSTLTMSQNQQNGNGNGSTRSHQSQFNNTYLQRDVQSLRGQLTMGEGSTAGDIFESIPFRGVRLVNSDDMLPSSQRAFAPVITGTARSNARVSVTQNGNLIYETSVPPGPFRLTDIANVGNGGELLVTVTEADGSKHVSTQTYSTLPVMKRPGAVDYEVVVAKYRNGGYTQGSRDPLFALATVKVGLPHYVTLYGGLLAAQGYQSLVLGTGLSLGLLGAISVDATLARAHLQAENEEARGASFSARYSKSMMTTGTTVDLTAYRYSTDRFYTLQEAMSHGYALQDGVAPWLGERRRSSWTLSLSQALGELGSISLHGSRSDYWNSNRTVNTLGASFSSSIKGVGYSLRYDIDQTNGGGRNDNSSNDWATNRQFSLNVNVPFSIFSPSSSAIHDISANATYTRDNHGRENQQVGLNGTFLDSALSWSASQSHDNQGGGTSGNLNASYQGERGNVGLGYGYSGNSRTVSANGAGGVVIHPHGITFSRALGDSMALVEAPGAGGVKVMGGATDGWGYAVVPNLQNYQRNTISLDPTTLPDGVDIPENSTVVYPTKGALVEAKFKTRVGRQAMLTLTFQGKPVPFGATASLPTDSEDNASIVGDGGMVYLTGAPQTGTLKVQWGNQPDQQCQVSYDLGAVPTADKKDPNAPTINIAQQTLTCAPVAGGVTAPTADAAVPASGPDTKTPDTNTPGTTAPTPATSLPVPAARPTPNTGEKGAGQTQ